MPKAPKTAAAPPAAGRPAQPERPAPNGRDGAGRKIDDTGCVTISLRVRPELIAAFDRMAAESLTGEAVSDLIRKAMLEFDRNRRLHRG